MEVCSFLVGEEQVRFPDGVQHGRVQIQRGVGVLAVGQPRVVPLLPEEDVHPVVLRHKRCVSLVFAVLCFVISSLSFFLVFDRLSNDVVQCRGGNALQVTRVT